MNAMATSTNQSQDESENPQVQDQVDSASALTKWTNIAAASAILFIGVGYTNTFGVFESHYQSTLFPDQPAEKLIVIGSVASSLYFVLGALTGRFADLVGYRTSLVLGTVLMVGSMFGASASKTFWQLFLSQGLGFGLGLAFVYMPATTISRQYFGARMHGLTNGIVVSGGALGGCVLPYCCQLMIDRYGLAATFRILGYLAIGVLVPSVAVLRNKSQSWQRSRGPIIDLAMMKDERFVWLVIACTVAMTGFLPRYFLIPSSAEAQGIGSTYASWLLGLMNGCSIVGRVGIGYLSDRLGKSMALTLSFVLCGLGHFIFWLPGATLPKGEEETATALFTLFVVYVGIFGSGFISLFPVVVADWFGSEDLASKTGLLNTAVGLSTLAGPSAVYAIVGSGAHRRWTAGVSTAGAFMIAGGLLLATTSAPWSRIKQRMKTERA